MEVLLVVLFLLSSGSGSVIIPEELPSLLSVAYSNIPPIKKGTDSRVGFGFAFGNHADFQVTFELGPQTDTLNLTGQSFPTNTKRQAPAPPPAKINKNREKFLQSEAGKYLQGWAEKMKYSSKAKRPPSAPPAPAPRPGDVGNLEEALVELVEDERGRLEIQQPRPGNVSPAALDTLAALYGQRRQAAGSGAARTRSEAEIDKITQDLSNVDLD